MLSPEVSWDDIRARVGLLVSLVIRAGLSTGFLLTDTGDVTVTVYKQVLIIT